LITPRYPLRQQAIGPVIIGRAEKGPALRPTTVNSFEEFVNIFGTPIPGNSGEMYGVRALTPQPQLMEHMLPKLIFEIALL
jgi:hypothetical protein